MGEAEDLYDFLVTSEFVQDIFGESFSYSERHKPRIIHLIDDLLELVDKPVQVFRMLAVDDAAETAEAIQETGFTGNYWAREESGADAYLGEGGDEQVLIRGYVDGANIDLIGTILQNLEFPEEQELVFWRGDVDISDLTLTDEEGVETIIDVYSSGNFEPGGDFGAFLEINEYEDYIGILEQYGNRFYKNEAWIERVEDPESRGRGRGWWGESERHREAAKKR